MTFCVGIKVRQGLVMLADTQIVRGSEQVNKAKLAVSRHRDASLFTMTSGLRSVRDKTVIYLDEQLGYTDNLTRSTKWRTCLASNFDACESRTASA